MFVGALVTAALVLGGAVLRWRTHNASIEPSARVESFKQEIYRVSWPSFAVGFAQFGIAALPIVILVLSPNPDSAGYVVLVGAALAWGCFGVWYIRKLSRTSVEFKDSHLVYCDGRRSKELAYRALQSVTTSSGYIVCSLAPDGARFVVPLQFSGNSMILARLRSICEETAKSSSAQRP